MNTRSCSRAAAAATLVLALSGGVLVGCGGSSGGGEDAFIGRWFQESPNPSDPTATGFAIACTDPNFTHLNGAALIWSTLEFERGTVTNLAEISGNCPILNYDTKGKTATVPMKDPYIQSDSGCVIQFTDSDSAGNALPAIFVLTPGDTWSFMLLDMKTTGGAPQGRLAGTATAQIVEQDATGNIVTSNPDCTYAGMDNYFRLTRP